MKICEFTKLELDKFREQCNFTEDERQKHNIKVKDSRQKCRDFFEKRCFFIKTLDKYV